MEMTHVFRHCSIECDANGMKCAILPADKQYVGAMLSEEFTRVLFEDGSIGAVLPSELTEIKE